MKSLFALKMYIWWPSIILACLQEGIQLVTSTPRRTQDSSGRYFIELYYCNQTISISAYDQA